MVTAHLDDTTVIHASQFPIKSVKLFSPGTAEISRVIPLPFLRSQDDPQVVEVVNLPVALQSVDVSVTSTSGDVTILDHYQASVESNPTSVNKDTPSSQTLRELEQERLRLEDEKRLRQQSFVLLTTYMDSLAQCKSHNQTEAAQMVSFFDEFIEIGITRAAVIAELDRKLVEIGSKVAQETDRLSKLNSNLPVKAVVVFSCNSQVPVEAAELTLTYLVKQLSWKPEYDLRIAMSDNTPSSTVTLDFRCLVTQWTGEDWDNVSLALTTADQVSQLIRVPEPKRIDVSLSNPNIFFPAPFARSGGLFGGGAERERETKREAPEWSQTTLFGSSAPANQGSFGSTQPQQVTPPVVPVWKQHAVSVPPSEEKTDTQAQTQAVSQLISHDVKDPITHITAGSVFIPSDHAEHHALIASIPLQAEFMRVAVPSIDPRVYYTCVVKNTSEYVLLPGTVKAYLNNKHVSSTEIHSTDTPQTLESCLAVDTGMKTIHNRAPEALASIGAFTAKSSTTYTSTIVVQNTHTEPIRGVIVRSSVPLPADPRITIALKEPAGLADIEEGNVMVKEGCLARWSTMGGRKGKQAGLFEWECNVNPGTEALKAVWEVCAPQDLKVLEQVRS